MDIISVLVVGYLCLIIGLSLGVVVGIRAEKDRQRDRMKQVAEKLAENPEAVGSGAHNRSL